MYWAKMILMSSARRHGKVKCPFASKQTYGGTRRSSGRWHEQPLWLLMPLFEKTRKSHPTRACDMKQLDLDVTIMRIESRGEFCLSAAREHLPVFKGHSIPFLVPPTPKRFRMRPQGFQVKMQPLTYLTQEKWLEAPFLFVANDLLSLKSRHNYPYRTL